MKTNYGENGDCVTTYEPNDGCGGCKINTGSITCQNCTDPKTGQLRNFEAKTDYWKRK